MKKILYVDMDGVLVDFQSGIDQMDEATLKEYHKRYDEIPDIFSLMKPIPGALEAFARLSKHFDTYILSTAPWENPSAWRHKLEWVQKYMGKEANRKLILTHNKHLNIGDFLVDDRTGRGADRFTGEHIHFGKPGFENWEVVERYLMERK